MGVGAVSTAQWSGTPGYPEENPTFFEDGESESSGRGKASAMGWKSMMQLCG